MTSSIQENIAAPTTYLDNSASIRFPYLDGLRGLAVILVVVGHYSLYIPEVAKTLTPLAKTGVWIFFLLSSFLLTRQMTLVLSRPPRVENILRYFARRILRILPLYYLTLALLLALPTFARQMFGGRSFSLLDHALLIYPQGNFWAISVEFEYYAVMPLLALVYLNLRSFNRSFGPLFGLSVVFLAIHAYRLSWVETSFPLNYPHIPPYAHFFLLGSGIAIISLYQSFFPRRTALIANVLFSLGVLIELFVFIYPYSNKDLNAGGLVTSWWLFGTQHPGQMIACGAILVGVLFSRSLQAAFSGRIIRFFGKISFSLYCLHLLPAAYLGALTEEITPLGATCAFFGLSIMLSVLTFYAIERPLMNLVRGPEQPSNTPQSVPQGCVAQPLKLGAST